MIRSTRHRFARGILEQVHHAIRHSRDNWHAPLAISWMYGLIVLSVAAPYICEPYVGWWPGYLLISVPAIACWQRGLAELLHESSHGALAENRIANFVWGTLFSGWCVGQSWHAYRESHTNHHVYLGDRQRDPDLAFQHSQGTYRTKSRLWFIVAYYVAPLLLIKTPAKVIDLLRHRLFSPREPWLEKLCRLLFYAAVGTIIVLARLWTPFILFWIVPLLTTFPMINYFIELMEHFPYVEENQLDLLQTRNRWTGRVMRFFTGTFNEHLHQTHHLFPACPYWMLPVVHELLMEDEDYRRSQYRDVGLIVPVIHGVPTILLRMLNYVK